jgi:hypothetical protein
MSVQGDLYEVTFVATHSEQVGMFRRHYVQLTTTGVGPTLAQIAAHFSSVYPAPIKALMAATATYNGLSVAKILPAPRTVRAIETTGVGAGTVVGDILPRQVRGIITLRTDLAGPAHRGRCYIPFPCELDNALGGVPVAGYMTNLNALGTVMLANTPALGAAGNQAILQPVLLRGVYDADGNRIDWTFSSLASFVSRPRWATQRSSGSYGAANTNPLV